VDLLTLLQQLINGLSLGSLYALIAIGYTLVYGILRLINFAHGDLLMVAAYVAVMEWDCFPGPARSFRAGHRAHRPHGGAAGARRLPAAAPGARISLLISAIAASFLLENLALVIAGAGPSPFPCPPGSPGPLPGAGSLCPA